MALQAGKPGDDYHLSATGLPSTMLPAAIRPYFRLVLLWAHLWAAA